MDSSDGENLPLGQCLEALLRARGMSMRALARRVEVAPSHLSRITRGADSKRPSGSLARRVATALDLPSDHFAEARIDTILECVGADAELRDDVYRLVLRRAGS